MSFNIAKPQTWFGGRQSSPTKSEETLPDMNREQFLHEMREIMTLAQLRDTSYSGGSLSATIPTINYDAGKYETLYKIFTGQSDTSVQLGGLLIQPVVYIFAGLLLGELPRVVCYDTDPASGEMTSNKLLTTFMNQFNEEHHSEWLSSVAAQAIYGDVYLTVGSERELEVLAPYPANINSSFNLVNNKLTRLSYAQTHIAKDDKGQAANIVVTRLYDADKIEVQIKAESGNSQGATDKPFSIQNTFGECPVYHLKHKSLPGFAFGRSEIFSLLPFMVIANNILLKAYEQQQYHGKPILTVTGIKSTVANWLQRSFGIDPTKPSDVTNSVMWDFMLKNKFMAFADDVTPKFLESQRPIGASAEVNQLNFDSLVKVSGLPAFMWGTELGSSNAVVREQYTALDAILKYRQAELGQVMKRILKYAVWYYSNVTETSDPKKKLVVRKLLKNPDQLDNLSIRLIWPSMLNSDLQLRLNALTMLVTSGNISQPTLFDNLSHIIPDTANEMELIKTSPVNGSSTPTGTAPPPETNPANVVPPSSVKDNPSPADANRKKQQQRDNAGNNANNSGGSSGN